MSNKTMNCGQVKRLLPPFLDEELRGGLREGVSNHLAVCPACRAALEALESDLALLKQVQTPEVSPYLMTRTMAEVRRGEMARVRVQDTGLRRVGFGLRCRALLTGAAAASLVALSIGLGVWLGSGLAQSPSPAATTTTEAALNYVASSTADVYDFMTGGD